MCFGQESGGVCLSSDLVLLHLIRDEFSVYEYCRFLLSRSVGCDFGLF